MPAERLMSRRCAMLRLLLLMLRHAAAVAADVMIIAIDYATPPRDTITPPRSRWRWHFDTPCRAICCFFAPLRCYLMIAYAAYAYCRYLRHVASVPYYVMPRHMLS